MVDLSQCFEEEMEIRECNIFMNLVQRFTDCIDNDEVYNEFPSDQDIGDLECYGIHYFGEDNQYIIGVFAKESSALTDSGKVRIYNYQDEGERDYVKGVMDWD